MVPSWEGAGDTADVAELRLGGEWTSRELGCGASLGVLSWEIGFSLGFFDRACLSQSAGETLLRAEFSPGHLLPVAQRSGEGREILPTFLHRPTPPDSQIYCPVILHIS